MAQDIHSAALFGCITFAIGSLQRLIDPGAATTDLRLRRPKPLGALIGEARGSSNEEIAQRGPQRKNSVIGHEVPAQGSMLPGVQPNVLDQEMPERAKRRLIPVRRREYCAKHHLEPAIFITR